VCRLSREREEVFVCEADLEGGTDREGEAAYHLRYFDAQICEHLLKSRSAYKTLPDGTIEKTFLFTNPGDEPEFEPIKKRLEDKGYGSLVVQPIMYRDSSRGVILIAEIDPRRYWSPSELELVKSVAGQVAVAIEQASLIEELSQKNDDLVQKNLNLDTKNLELRHMQSQLIHHEKMASLGRLVAGIAHELNNPINFVYGNLPYLKEYVNDLKRLVESFDQLNQAQEVAKLKEEVKYDFLMTDLDNIIADLNEGADRIRQIIRNLRSFSRLDEAELKEASIQECIESTLKLLSQYYGRDKVELVRNFGDVQPILCYPGQLNQVLMNLLTNAAQALEGIPGPKVEVTLEVTDKELMITVSDNGPGIKDDIQSKIFDPFFTTKPVGQGTGLGLSICHSIMERHGGRIELKSELGQGTTFRAILPILESPDDFGRFVKKSIYQVSE
ncbi:MAG: GAF domain-containing protein, partial [Cyanobacteria bacterium]|nr:GAF domain-containing protein [Cyanobacteriota bacterium]